MDSLYSLSGKNIVVTGAGAGIGNAITKRLAEAGAKVFALSLEDVNYLNEQFAGLDVVSYSVDVSDRDQTPLAFKDIVRKCHSLNGLVNNAADIVYKGEIRDINKETFDAMVKNNLYSALLCSQHAVAAMLNNGGMGGSIVNIGSIEALQAYGESVPYALTKAAIQSLTQQFAVRYSPEGIRVNCVLPGNITTERNMQKTDPCYRRAFEERVPLRRLGTPEEIAEVCYFLLCPAASYITGANIVVDGGYTAKLPIDVWDMIKLW